MNKLFKLSVGALLLAGSLAHAADDFLSEPGKLKRDARFGDDLVYFPDDVQDRLPNYDSIMVDEPILFLAEDSKYKGFKASDLAAISDMLRKSFISGLKEQPMSSGNFKVVDEPGPGVLYVRLALKDLYVKKEKRGLFSYTPVGMVAHGVSEIASDAIDKTTLVEMKVEVEMQETENGEVLFAAVLDRGHRRDKKAHQKEEEAGWEASGAIAEVLGRRLACRLDNTRLPAAQQVDCLKTIPVKQ